ncbi:signal peptide peptidase SppA [Candidatus Woesearchaeota archaeon]|nr:signal peptide peptidase SppA [Candidatus Woesearchaeota archaeon]
MKEKTQKNKDQSWKFIFKTLIMLFILSWILAGILPALFYESSEIGNIAVIPIKGVITSESGSTLGQSNVAATELIKLIKKADESPGIQAILFDINSPGGSAVASSNIAEAIKKVNKTTISVITEVGASGAYWAATATDKIFANKMSITGSIGVIGSYLEFANFLQNYNITYQRLTAGKYKDLGSPLKELEYDEKLILQSIMDKIHNYFIEDVALNRNLSKEKVEELANGLFYLGEDAKEYGLIDFIGSKEDAVTYIEKELNITAKLAEYKKEKTFIEILSQAISEKFFYVGKGISEGFLSKEKLQILT